MKLKCRLFGHKPEPWFSLPSHPKIQRPHYDGILRAHRDLYTRCERCGECYQLGKVIDRVLSGERGKQFYDSYRKEPGQ